MPGIIPMSMASRKLWGAIRECPLSDVVWEHCTWDSKLTNHYSIVSQLACLLDLNTLHDLSRTCRQFRVNLFQYRVMLKMLTLRCENESPETSGSPAQDGQGLTAAQLYSQQKRPGRFTSGKIGPCARDMVGECRKCSRLVCRVRRLRNTNLSRTTELQS